MTRKSWCFAIAIVAALGASAEELSRWKHFQKLRLDTSATGANVAGDVQNFPVPVTLNAGNFNFNQARSDGADIRFSLEQDGSLLSYHIEHWARSNQSALVWVKVPLVRGTSTNQTVFLHWGHDAASSTGDSRAVFDAGEGFVGVWHLGDEGGMEAGGYQDATANDADGTGINLSRSSRVEGRMGRGVWLRHAATQWIRIGGENRTLFDITNHLTFSIWAKAMSYANRAQSGYETMFAKGDNSWRLQKFGIRDWHQPPAELIEICVEQPPKADLCVVGKTDMATNLWYHFVGVHDHPKVRLYVNGVLDKEESFNVPWRSDDHAVGIGNQSQFPDKGRSWDGVLDEARVMNVVKDENWIKLDYESQREGQRFLTFGETGKRF